MSEYLKIMYQAWCRNPAPNRQSTDLESFVKYASKALGRTEEEIRNFCDKQGWFK